VALATHLRLFGKEYVFLAKNVHLWQSICIFGIFGSILGKEYDLRRMCNRWQGMCILGNACAWLAKNVFFGKG